VGGGFFDHEALPSAGGDDVVGWARSSGLLGFQAFPDALLRALENRFSVSAAETIQRYQGVIVLGGAIGHPYSFLTHGKVPLGDAAERMTVPVALVRQHPDLALVFSGGEDRLLSAGVTESELASVFFSNKGWRWPKCGWKEARATPVKTRSK
jgi:hypothetical protein